MDSVDEDVSARVLLQSVIHTESSRSPITRSASQAQFQSPGSRVRRSIRLRRSDVGALTPQEALKQSIKNKLREVWLNRSTSRFSLPVPPSKRRTISEGVRKINTPAPATASLLYDDDITPRYLLRGILQTEPETSLLVQDRPVKKEPELPYTNSSLHSNRPSTGLSDLDLPDMTTTVNLSNTVKGLSRKRPRRSLNITAFNRQLEHEDGEGEGGSATEKYLSSLSSASPSSITFSLKTPFVDVQTEKRGFQRKVTNRKKICLEEFDKALQNRQAAMGGDPELSVREDQQGLSETIRSEGFTSGLSDLTAPDITHDIITSNTALYSLPVDTATTFTITTQDKDTITGTQIQREMGGMKDEDEKDMEEVGEQNENKMELDNKDGEDLAGDAGQREDSVRQKESKSQTEEVEAVADSQTEEEDEVAESQTEEEDEVAESQTEEEDEVAESQTEEDEVAESQTEEDEVAESQTEEDEVAESQTEEDEVTESQTAEDEVTESQTAEDEVTESQTAEDEVAESQTAEDEVAETQTAEDEVAESQTAEDEVAESQTAEDEVAESQTAEDEVAESQTAEDEVAESQTAEDEVAESQTADDVADEGGQVVEEGQEKRLTSQSLTHNAKHISRRAYCSEGGGKVAGVIEGGRGYKSMGAAVVVEVVAVAYSQTEEEDEVAESQTEEDEVAESQTEEDEVAESQTEEDEVAESQTEEDEVAESQTADDVADEGGQVVEEGQEKRLTSQSLTHNAKHISRRAYCSEGGGKVAGVIEGGRGYKSMGAALHPTETGWAGRRSEGDTAGEWHSGPEVGASESAHTRTVTLGSVPPSLLPQEDEQELEGLSRTGTSCGNEEMENSMPPLEMTFEPENNTPHSSNSSLHPITAQSPAEHEEDWDDVEEGDGIRSEELSMKTPAFVREKRNALPIDPLATPTVLKDLQPSVLSGAAAAVKPKAVRGKRTGSAKKDPGLSKSYIMSVFKHFAKTKVSTDVYPVLKEIMERYFDRLADDLETFAAHAKRKTIEVEDVELLMRRQGFLTDSMPVNVLIEKYLPMESRKLLIPVATSGNYVIPKPRRK
ncbi:probable serine/threonine-protein kinase kinX isoform X5 [Salvelinus alpinus]|uniref:probable serine/threonine-protein kinase kinX isoform X5 n=1 Tax=Salvelinus alpinus TaxID=8036 RepID=UPI0039FBB3EF